MLTAHRAPLLGGFLSNCAYALTKDMARYGPTAQMKVKKAVHEYKRGRLKMGKSGKRVQSRRQAIAT